MLTVHLGTDTSEETCIWVEYCNSPAGTQYADMCADYDRIILGRIPVDPQAFSPTFTVEYRPDLLDGITVIHGKRYFIDEIGSGRMNSTRKKPRPKGKWKSPSSLLCLG